MEHRTAPAERGETHQRPPRSYVRYPWHTIEIGKWQRWLHLPDETTDADARRKADSLRIAARAYAERRGLQVESRSTRGKRSVELLFAQKEGS